MAASWEILPMLSSFFILPHIEKDLEICQFLRLSIRFSCH